MAKYVFAVDLGGTTVKMGLFDLDGNVLEKWEIVTRKENGGEKILPDIAESIKAKMSEKSIVNDDVLGIGRQQRCHYSVMPHTTGEDVGAGDYIQDPRRQKKLPAVTYSNDYKLLTHHGQV